MTARLLLADSLAARAAAGIIAAVTASLVESSRERFTAPSDEDDTRQFTEISVDLQGSKRHLSSRRPRDQPMGPADDTSSIRPAPSEEQARVTGHVGAVVYRDPEHVAERLTQYTADLLGRPSVGTG